jgi:hypothetical protein
MCLVSACVSLGPCAFFLFIFSLFFFNWFFSDAPCDPSTPSSEYTRYHRLQKSGIIYSIHIPFFSYLRIKFTTISLLFSPSGISLSKKKTAWPHQFWRNSLTRNTFIIIFGLTCVFFPIQSCACGFYLESISLFVDGGGGWFLAVRYLFSLQY